MDNELIEFLKSKANWPASSNDTFRQTCGGKHANMYINVADGNERKQFCELVSQSTIWRSALEGDIDYEIRKSFEIATTGKRLDCLTQVYPKSDFKFAFMTTSCAIDLTKLIESIPKEYGRFYLFQRSPISNMNEEYPVYQCYFPDCWVPNVDNLQNMLKEIEVSSGCKIDRRIYSNCIQFPGCFVTNSSSSFFKWIQICSYDFPPPTPEDILLYHYSTVISSPEPKRLKINHNDECEISAPCDSLRFVDAWVYHLITCSQSDELYQWAGCLISRAELESLFHKRRPSIQFNSDALEKHLINKWNFVCTKIIQQSEIFYLIPTRTQLMSLLKFDTRRNLNSYKNNINLRDLSLDYGVEDGQVKSIFRDFEQQLQLLFNKYDAFVGCVAWLNDSHILSMMKEKSLGIVVTKDPKNWADEQSILLLKQTTLCNYSVTAGVHPGTRFDDTKDNFETAGEVRCIGDRSIAEDIILMHNKFLVFGEIQKSDESHFVFVPKCVWTGSRNLTFAAKRHKENAVVITNDNIANSYRSEWVNLYLNSERLSSDSLKYLPTDHFVV